MADMFNRSSKNRSKHKSLFNSEIKYHNKSKIIHHSELKNNLNFKRLDELNINPLFDSNPQILSTSISKPISLSDFKPELTNQSSILHTKPSNYRVHPSSNHPTSIYGNCQIISSSMHPTTINPIFTTHKRYSLRQGQSTNIVVLHNSDNFRENQDDYSSKNLPQRFPGTYHSPPPIDYTTSYVSLMYYSARNRNYCRKIVNI